MTNPLITIDERMYTTREVAELISRRVEYVQQLIESGILRATRPASPRGRYAQWLIYPASIRSYLGVRATPKQKRLSRQAKAEIAAGRALLNLPAVP